MTHEWKNAIVTQVMVALYVPPGTGHRVHTNRPFHGFVINDLHGSDKNYHFSDGRILETKPGDVFYLPKGSSYQVETLGRTGGCWAINFDLLDEIPDAPFVVTPKNPTAFLGLFKEASAAFKLAAEDRDLTIRKDLYSILLKLRKEVQRGYIPSSKIHLIQPALDRISTGFTDNNLTVQSLAECCGISGTYLRKIFSDCLGITPQDYIISRRIDYAKELLCSGQFSVSEVAEMCGYFEPCHFSRAFTKHIGVSPKVYAKKQEFP